MSRRGFANPEYLIALFVVGIILAIGISQFQRVRQRAHDRGLIAAVNGMVRAEDAYFDAHHRFSDTLTVPLMPGIRLEQVRGDSSGWSVVAVTDSADRPHRHCALFVGEAFRPLDGHVDRAGEMACW